MQKIKTIFLGSTAYSKALLEDIISHGFIPEAVFTIPEQFNISYSPTAKVKNYHFSDLKKIATAHHIPCYEVHSEPGRRLTDFSEVIQTIAPDIILVLGWYYMIPKKIRALAKKGAWGIHASLLPDYAGGAPLVWAMIQGEKKTGVTLFRMEDGVDDGDIIAQEAFSIDFQDTIAEVYQKAIECSKKILIEALRDIEHVQYQPQNKEKIKIYPQRKPEDGEIHFNRSALDIYNFIRAQSFPYPGAFFRGKDGKKVIIERARLADESEAPT